MVFCNACAGDIIEFLNGLRRCGKAKGVDCCNRYLSLIFGNREIAFRRDIARDRGQLLFFCDKLRSTGHNLHLQFPDLARVPACAQGHPSGRLGRDGKDSWGLAMHISPIEVGIYS